MRCKFYGYTYRCRYRLYCNTKTIAGQPPYIIIIIIIIIKAKDLAVKRARYIGSTDVSAAHAFPCATTIIVNIHANSNSNNNCWNNRQTYTTVLQYSRFRLDIHRVCHDKCGARSGYSVQNIICIVILCKTLPRQYNISSNFNFMKIKSASFIKKKEDFVRHTTIRIYPKWCYYVVINV